MLPPLISITPEMLRLISELDEFKGHWRLLGKLSPERLTSLRKVATIESVGSSTRIEGSKLTDRQGEELLGRLHLTAFSSRDEQEVAGYAYVVDQIFDAFEQIPLTENMLSQLHRDLLRHSTKDERHRGHYKTLPNPHPSPAGPTHAGKTQHPQAAIEGAGVGRSARSQGQG
jgi:hypothetical protein